MRVNVLIKNFRPKETQYRQHNSFESLAPVTESMEVEEGEIQAEADASADLAAAAATPVPAVPDAEILSGVPDADLLDEPPEPPNLPTVPAAPPAASDEVWRV